ncbi:MAG: hypothetical protein WC635_06850 [Bacteriovorax sp.]|jgi:hypothetical protein
MRFVKLNNSLFIIGDETTTLSLAQLSDFGLNLPSLNVASLKPEDFTYNNVANKNIRLHSRKTRCLLECLNYLKFDQIKNNYSSERIGIYINGSHNVLDFKLPGFSKLDSGENSLYEIYRGNISPTHNVQNLVGIIPGHIAIYHEIHGPTFAISSMGINQILNKARIDLTTDAIDLAVVGIVNTYEDPMTLAWHSNKSENKNIAEAAGIILLTKNDHFLYGDQNSSSNYYGYLSGLLT